MIDDTVVLPYQQRYVKRIVDEVLSPGHDHVLFQIDNESGIGDASLEPDPYWASFVRKYAESTYRRTVYVCTSRRFHTPTPCLTRDFQDWHNPEIRIPIVHRAFNFCDISQNNGNGGQTHYDNFIWYRSKVLEHGPRPINHTKCYHFHWPTGSNFSRDRSSPSDDEAADKFWRAVFGGAASIRFHRHTAFRPRGLREGFGLEAEAQAHIRSLRLLVDSVHIFTVEPRNDLLSSRADDEAYALAEQGKQYVVYFTGKGDRSVVIDLSGLKGIATERWLDVEHSTWLNETTLRSAELRPLSAPGPGQWAVLIRMTQAAVPEF